MCFFQTLRPTESHSQTPSYQGSDKPSHRNSSGNDEEHFKSNTPQLWTQKRTKLYSFLLWPKLDRVLLRPDRQRWHKAVRWSTDDSSEASDPRGSSKASGLYHWSHKCCLPHKNSCTVKSNSAHNDKLGSAEKTPTVSLSAFPPFCLYYSHLCSSPSACLSFYVDITHNNISVWCFSYCEWLIPWSQSWTWNHFVIKSGI